MNDIIIHAIVLMFIISMFIGISKSEHRQHFMKHWNDEKCYTLYMSIDIPEHDEYYQYPHETNKDQYNVLDRASPFKFGKVLEVDIDTKRHGKWLRITRDNFTHAVAWRLCITFPKATFLSIVCDTFILPSNSELRITGVDKNQLLGPFTAQNTMTKFSMPPIPGECLDIEYVSFVQDRISHIETDAHAEITCYNNLGTESHGKNMIDHVEFISENIANGKVADSKLQLHICKIIHGFESGKTTRIHGHIKAKNKGVDTEHHEHKTKDDDIHLVGLNDTEQETLRIKGSSQSRLSGACHINSVCEEALPWQNQSNSVALLMIPDCDGYCTGCLLNNPLEDGRQLFLTAYHCVKDSIYKTNHNKWQNLRHYTDDENIYDYILTIFNYQANKCHNTQNSDENNDPQERFNKCQMMMRNSVRGLKILAWNEAFDIALCEILGEIPKSLNVYMAGFSADKDEIPPRYCVGFHHPAGDVKKMCIRNMPIEKYCWNHDECASGHKYHWRVQNWTFGATEIGSSGSPLFNNEGLVIGELRGGESSCTTRSGYDIYVSLSSAYHNFGFSKYLNPTNIENLKFVSGGYLNDIKQKHNKCVE